jgi:selenocysteine-specific elongation factor
LVDRSFVIKGFGTVVTGTVLSGRLKQGDEVEILPAKLRRRVRGLQAHGNEAKELVVGDRAAVNLQGISKAEITRGDVLLHPETLVNTNEFIGILRTVSKLPVKISNRSKIRVYVGTAEKIGQLIWFEPVKYLEEETSYHVRIKLDTPLVAARNDPFLIRLHSPLITLAGGTIIEINPPKIHHRKEEWENHFEIMTSQDYHRILEAIIFKNYLNPLSLSTLEQKLFDDKHNIGQILSDS